MTFVVFGLPRSRTAWLAHWLEDTAPVGHDLAIHADSAQHFLDLLWHDKAGTCETSAVKAHRLIRRAIPKAKFVTIRRPAHEVADSLARFGIVGQAEELALRDSALDDAESAGALRIEYSSLLDVNCCAALWEHLHGTQFNFRRWQIYVSTQIQVDMSERLALLRDRRAGIAHLEADVARLTANPDPRFYRVGREPWVSIWADAKHLGAENYLEVNAGVRAGHPFAPDSDLISEMERLGVFIGFSARCNGDLIGYASWSISKNPESVGMLLADQGAWYVQEGYPGIGRKLLEVGLSSMRSAGAHEAQLHSPFNGRGAKLGKLFQRMGARPIQTRYALPLGGR